MATKKELEEENAKLRKLLNIYKQERDRFAHTNPEISGRYFISGAIGEVDGNMLPEKIMVCPAYGCDWSQIYIKQDDEVRFICGS